MIEKNKILLIIGMGSKMKRWLFSIVWQLSEILGISLGRFALFVFHKMLGINAGKRTEK